MSPDASVLPFIAGQAFAGLEKWGLPIRPKSSEKEKGSGTVSFADTGS